MGSGIVLGAMFFLGQFLLDPRSLGPVRFPDAICSILELKTTTGCNMLQFELSFFVVSAPCSVLELFMLYGVLHVGFVQGWFRGGLFRVGLRFIQRCPALI